MHIPKGKCFGPFNGKITDRQKPPDKMHFLVSQVSVYNCRIQIEVSFVSCNKIPGRVTHEYLKSGGRKI